MGLEYMFFDAALRDRFVAFASALGIPSTVEQDNIAGFVVELPDNLDDAQQEALEAEYEAIMDAQMLAAESDAELVSHHAAGIMVTLSDGTTRSVRIPPPVARRLFEHFSVDEIHDIASAIAQAIENPSDLPLCKKLD
ncbi:hypothetical protein Tbd_1054 [Thiobacillus denitrificans ATCC 25259]|uniref:Uncharacterized protein n=1 Tax=Thiobacillus denitrificans (strain ATCC 25259 / T1) TaxID=292415 RepID=Q3SJY9_THIDA|nr:hypothetical protein [Thiobacillus denitrificans]AAZ97007.1 hypothetical protein Tbd_1054 [Thiobacillus denitrificans ATCC 25259]